MLGRCAELGRGSPVTVLRRSTIVVNIPPSKPGGPYIGLPGGACMLPKRESRLAVCRLGDTMVGRARRLLGFCPSLLELYERRKLGASSRAQKGKEIINPREDPNIQSTNDEIEHLPNSTPEIQGKNHSSIGRIMCKIKFLQIHRSWRLNHGYLGDNLDVLPRHHTPGTSERNKPTLGLIWGDIRPTSSNMIKLRLHSFQFLSISGFRSKPTDGPRLSKIARMRSLINTKVLFSPQPVAGPYPLPGKSLGTTLARGNGIILEITNTRPNGPPATSLEDREKVPVKGSLASKVKDERRKKSSSTSGLRRRLVEDGEISEEEASELNVPIPGVMEQRKGRKWSKASRKAARLEAAKAAEPVKVEILEVGEEGMLMEELAYNLAINEADILAFLFSRGVKPDAVHILDKDMVKMICKEYDVEVIEVDSVRVEEMAKKKEVLDEEDLDMLEDRPPVITIMGHVDHGKTTLLDYIRKSRVVASEAGGITQGIGAYKVLVPVDGKPQPCIFLDTPGHEAFGAMRARGARVTDIAIIVVAADDGVRPQTNEAIAHANVAGVPIIIAINKACFIDCYIDKDGANPERVMQELSSVGLMPEIWGGHIPMVQISALKGENIDELLETVMLVAEMQELKANPKRNAKGTIIEAGLDKAKGAVASLIVQNGTLKKGDIVVCGEAYGKVRAMFDDRGGRVDEAGPSMAVQVIGLNRVPIAGDEFEVVETLDLARERAELRAESLRVARISAKAGETKVTLSSIASAVAMGKQAGLDMHQLNIILKVDVQGSIEAIRQALQVLPQDNVNLKFLLQAPGEVTTSDVDLAVASEAIIFGFNVKVPGSVKSYADKKTVEIHLYRVIYDLIDDMRNAMEGLLESVEEQIQIGTGEVRATFSSGSGRVAGCMITEGKVVKECGARVIRNGKIIHSGTVDSLRRVKEDVKEVGAGLECGIGVDDFDDWEAGDVIEAFNTVKKQRTLEEASASVTAALTRAGCT
ncbi:hypothetical protein ZIOFF_044404 [Zingiber officinale]|uniref:Translation initiation factor IF-2, chloroplastic n=1 Tax=Zingiber officinale TaxID=94328 RepID=A0A8J5G130_ZINOF|nr:hypothetical protein ZIOFF_044404 [Zingiber officinale]